MQVARDRNGAPRRIAIPWSDRQGTRARDRLAMMAAPPISRLDSATRARRAATLPRVPSCGARSRGGSIVRPLLWLAAGFLMLAAAPVRAADRDGDGVDDLVDDCLEVANPGQRDTDRDGFGNACDADFDGDGNVGLGDVLAIRSAFGAGEGSDAYSADLDLDGDGQIGFSDLLETQRRFGTAPGPSGLGCAAKPPCFAGSIALVGAEEVLSRSVRLTWTAASPSFIVKIERRVRGGAWELVGVRWGGRDRDFVDRGADGFGLAAGRYEYRVTGDGPPSSPWGVTLGEECAGQPAASPILPVVEIVDHEPDGDYDGGDVAAALAECSRLHGCVLRALPVTYDDVNVELGYSSGYDFSRGLVIEGYGSASVFRSRVYSQQDHDPSLCAQEGSALCYQPRPVFSIVHTGPTRLDGVRFRNFQIEGRKREQPDPGSLWNTWQHWGVLTISPTLGSTDGGCVHHVTARELMSGGFGVQNGNRWIFEDSTAMDIGCVDDLTPCEGLVRTPEILMTPGERADGVGFGTGERTIGTVVRNSRAVRATKYGIFTGGGAQGFHFHDNVVEASGGSGIGCNGCGAGVIERNLVSSMHYPTGRNAKWPEGFTGDTSHGINCVGTGHDLSILQNIVRSGDGTGVRILCSGPNLLVQGNAILGNCLKYGSSLQLAFTEGVQLLGNTIWDPPKGCRVSVQVTASRDVRIEGGSIESGPRTQVGLFLGWPTQPTSGVVLRNLRVSGRGSNGVGVQLDASSSGTTLYDSVCASGFPTPLLDQNVGGAIRAPDPAGACVP